MRYGIAAATLALAGLMASGCSALVENDGRGHVNASPVDAAAALRPAVHSARHATAEAAQHRGCEHNTASQLVHVSLRRQHLWMCHRQRIVYSTPITSGMSTPDTRTPTGTYRMEGGDRNTTLTLSTGQQFAVKYWIPFDAPLYGFHDASWQKFPYGSAKYRKHGSHGCVHMPLKAIAFLYHWAHIGARVRINP